MDDQELAMGSLTSEGEDGAVGTEAGQVTRHVTPSCVTENGGGIQIVCHGRSAGAQLFAHPPIRTRRQRRQCNLAVLVLPVSRPLVPSGGRYKRERQSRTTRATTHQPINKTRVRLFHATQSTARPSSVQLKPC